MSKGTRSTIVRVSGGTKAVKVTSDAAVRVPVQKSDRSRKTVKVPRTVIVSR